MDQPRKQLDALTGLRFLAAFAIVIHHSRGLFFSNEQLARFPLDSGVSLFFVLSGFILTYVHPELPTRRDVQRFYISRVARIWPVHLFALGSAVTLLPVPAFGILRTIANVLMVHAWVPIASYGFSYNAVSWSISTEMGFYLLFPLLLRLSWPLKLGMSAALLIGSIAVCHIYALPRYDGREVVSSFAILFFNPVARLFEFALGMCCALLYGSTRPRLGNSVLLWTLAEVATVTAFLWYVFFELHDVWDFAKASSVPVSVEYLYHASAGPFFAAIILAVAGERGLLAQFLALRAMVFLGNISFALYMTHQILINVYAAHSSQFPLSFLTLLALLLIFASAVYLLIENPMRILIVGAFDGRRVLMS